VNLTAKGPGAPGSPGRRAIVLIALIVLISAAFLIALMLRSPARTHQPAIPRLAHVFLVVEENRAYDQIIDNASAPYINQLRKSSGLATAYHAVVHPSLGNYLALTGGATFDNPSGCIPVTCPIPAPNIADRIEAAGKTWRAYVESMPAPCSTANHPGYAVAHNPFVYYDDIRSDRRRCAAHDVPYSNLSADLASAATTPNFVMIVPSQCHSMHDCVPAKGDDWLRKELPRIFSSPAWTTQPSALFLVWDEDNFTPQNRVAMLVMGESVKRDYSSARPYDHYSLMRTIELSLGLRSLTRNDASAVPMSDLFIAR
jgi:phosphatidylinositol-3-phosphatase